MVNDELLLPIAATRRPRRPARPVEVEVGRRTAYFTGSGVGQVMDLLGITRMRCPHTRRVCCPIDRADDVIAYLEHKQKRAVTLVAGDR